MSFVSGRFREHYLSAVSVICVWHIEGVLIDCSECVVCVWHIEGVLIDCSKRVICVWQAQGALIGCSECHLYIIE